MAEYRLYGRQLIANDKTLRDFSLSLLKNIYVEFPDGFDEDEKILDVKDEVMERVSNYLSKDISRTDIDYRDLLVKYRGEIGDVMYQLEMQLRDPMLVLENFSFIKNTQYTFEKLVYYYIFVHFEELLLESITGVK
jgi:predicted ester cyclase